MTRQYKTLAVVDQDKKNSLGLDVDQQAAVSGVKGSVGKADVVVEIQKKTGQEIKQNSNVVVISGPHNDTPYSDATTTGVGLASSWGKKHYVDPETNETLKFNPNIYNDFASSTTVATLINPVQEAGVSAGTLSSDTEMACIYTTTDRHITEGTAGIKMITGRKQMNAKGGEITTISGVEMIAGNDSKDIQAMVKAGNLKQAMLELCTLIQKISDSIHLFAKHQNDFNNALKDHVHPDALAMLVGLVAQSSPTAITDGCVIKSPEVVMEGTKTTMMISEFTLPDMETHRTNIDNLKGKFLGGSEQSDIGSQHHKLT